MYFRAIVFLLLFFLLYRVLKARRQQSAWMKNCAHNVVSSAAGGEDLVEDPVCRKHIPVSQAYRKDIGGKTHYFCGKDCFEKFMSSQKTSLLEEL